MSLFLDRWNRKQGRLDGAFGEPLLIRPQAPARYVAGGDDPDRPAFTVVGILDMPASTVIPEGSHAYGGNRPQIDVPAIKIDFDVRVFSGEDQWPRQGDRIQATSRPGQPEFEVTAALPDGIGRVTFKAVPVL